MTGCCCHHTRWWVGLLPLCRPSQLYLAQLWVIRVNNNGLRTQPWGTPVIMVMVSEVRLPTRTVWDLFERKSNIELQSATVLLLILGWNRNQICKGNRRIGYRIRTYTGRNRGTEKWEELEREWELKQKELEWVPSTSKPRAVTSCTAIGKSVRDVSCCMATG